MMETVLSEESEYEDAGPEWQCEDPEAEYDAPVGDEEGAAEATAEGEESKHDDSTDDAMDRRAALKRVGPSDIFFLRGGGGGKKISPHPYLFFRVSTCHVSQRNRPAKKKSPRQEEVRRA